MDTQAEYVWQDVRSDLERATRDDFDALSAWMRNTTDVKSLERVLVVYRGLVALMRDTDRWDTHWRGFALLLAAMLNRDSLLTPSEVEMLAKALEQNRG